MSQRRSNVCPFLYSICFFQVLSSNSAGEARQSEGVEGDDEVDIVQRFLLHNVFYHLIFLTIYRPSLVSDRYTTPIDRPEPYSAEQDRGAAQKDQ
jgi:hypothetical protein